MRIRVHSEWPQRQAHRGGSTGRGERKEVLRFIIFYTNRGDIFLNVFFRRASPAHAFHLTGLPRRHGVCRREDLSDDIRIQI